MAHLMATASATDFLTAKALGTFTGASLATVVVGNTFRYISRRDWPVIPLLLALVFSYVAAQEVGHPHGLGDWALILLNGCLLFCTALGANEVLVSATTGGREGVKAHGKPAARSVRWNQSWLRRSP
jgi:hypothetical protein